MFRFGLLLVLLPLTHGQRASCTDGSTPGLDRCVDRVFSSFGAFDAQTLCSAAPILGACARNDNKLCSTDPKSHEAAENGYIVGIAKFAEQELGENAVRSCPTFLNAISKFYNDVFGGSRTCNLEGATAAIERETTCQSAALDRLRSRIPQGQVQVGVILKHLCNFRDEFTGCFRDLSCHSRSSRNKALSEMQKLLNDLQNIGREDFPEFSYNEHCSFVQSRYRRSAVLINTEGFHGFLAQQRKKREVVIPSAEKFQWKK